jgi:hypothetical protein
MPDGSGTRRFQRSKTWTVVIVWYVAEFSTPLCSTGARLRIQLTTQHNSSMIFTMLECNTVLCVGHAEAYMIIYLLLLIHVMGIYARGVSEIAPLAGGGWGKASRKYHFSSPGTGRHTRHTGHTQHTRHRQLSVQGVHTCLPLESLMVFRWGPQTPEDLMGGRASGHPEGPEARPKARLKCHQVPRKVAPKPYSMFIIIIIRVQ